MKIGLDHVLEEIKAGNSPAEICKKYNVYKQKVDYYVAILKKQGCIKRVGYGTWEFVKEVQEVQKRGKGSLEVNLDFKEIRGHAFIWKIEFEKPYDWRAVVLNYNRKAKRTLTFNTICNGKILRTMIDGKKVWLGKKGLTIYEPLDFMGRSGFEAKGKAVFEMDLLVKKIIEELGQRMKLYRFTTSREHYAQIKNSLAKQYNDQGEKLIIRDEEGTAWLWIDHSHGEHELETADPLISRQVQIFYNDHKKDGFQTTPTVINQKFANLEGVFPAMEEYNKNLKLHIEVQQEQLKTQKQLQMLLQKLAEK